MHGGTQVDCLRHDNSCDQNINRDKHTSVYVYRHVVKCIVCIWSKISKLVMSRCFQDDLVTQHTIKSSSASKNVL
jgi:hypothetical protein